MRKSSATMPCRARTNPYSVDEPVRRRRTHTTSTNPYDMTMFVWTSTFEDAAEGAGSAAIVGVYEGGLAALAAKFP